jgi:hypothetical protein
MTAAAEEAKRRGEDDKTIQKLEQMKAVLEKGGEFALVVKLVVKLAVKLAAKRAIEKKVKKLVVKHAIRHRQVRGDQSQGADQTDQDDRDAGRRHSDGGASGA